ncbi:hypothetical protein [Streptomyces sp. H27-D2]|uniref:hypothetical protein n=1 Tax=Streptomyces sp. H27-D2 TaxID=3046304 RepID=UPI002DBCC174|nr:hypothetical protein [Streptomyces sp. H27-D2]MEC4015140.1 hypothetical protein [Streptomyces sp. H27-D2]
MALRRRHRSTVLAALAALAIVPITVGCGAVEKAMDCAQLAVDVSKDVDKLQNAASDVSQNPQDAQKFLDTLDKDLDKMGDKTDDADVSKAVDGVQKAVDNAQAAVDKNQAPDLTPIADAAGELTKVCSPG